MEAMIYRRRTVSTSQLNPRRMADGIESHGRTAPPDFHKETVWQADGVLRPSANGLHWWPEVEHVTKSR